MSKLISSSSSKALQIFFVTAKSVKFSPKASVFKNTKFAGKYKQTYIDLSDNQLFVGAEFKTDQKSVDPYYSIQWYELGACLAKALSGTKIDKVQVNLPKDTKLSSHQAAQLILGIMQASWHYDAYLSKKSAKTKLYDIYCDAGFAKLVAKKTDYIGAVNEAMVLARTIVNEPPETLHPISAANLVQKTFSDKKNVTVQVHDEKWLEKQGMEGITFVGRGSRYQPRLVHVVVKPKKTAKHRIVLVGKGLTYDSGGMDIKIGGHMRTMKMDMAGSATMFAVTKALAELGLEHTELHWLSAFAENMIGPNSYKADDVITTYSGQTVEVHNTDAEGRLTLADVLSYSSTLKADYIIDAATLTGAAIVALSERFTAMMGNDTELICSLLTAFKAEGEYTVHTPMPEVLREAVKGEISDLINTSTLDREAGHITAGLFLSHFVNQKNFRNPKLKIKNPQNIPWVHLDIAGSAYNNGKNGLEAKGATGQSIRTLVSWIQSQDK